MKPRQRRHRACPLRGMRGSCFGLRGRATVTLGTIAASHCSPFRQVVCLPETNYMHNDCWTIAAKSDRYHSSPDRSRICARRQSSSSPWLLRFNVFLVVSPLRFPPRLPFLARRVRTVFNLPRPPQTKVILQMVNCAKITAPACRN